MTFTASNGYEVDFVDGEQVRTRTGQGSESGGHIDALREFFQHERDEELGRWRWPEDTDFTVRIAPAHARDARYPGLTVAIEQESSGYVGYYTRGRLPEVTDKTGGIVRAGHAYFEAHPEPKPWEDAKVGEVWALTMDDGVEHDVFIHEDRTVGGRGGISTGGAYFDIDDGAGITAGRRIWPEES